jgi:hypothetical protein
VFALNLFSILFAGVAVSAWLLHFTDWFEALGTLLALGGLFSWLAFVSRVLPDDRVKGLQKLVADKLLDRPATWKVALGTLAVLFVLSLPLGALQVDNEPGEGDHAVRAYSGPDPGAPAAYRLPANGRLRFPLLAGTYKLKVSGIAARKATVRPWWWSWRPDSYSVPTSLRQPLVLIVPEASVANKAVQAAQKSREGKPDAHPYKLLVSVNGAAPWVIQVYAGGPIWVGSEDEDIEVPPAVRERKEWMDLQKLPLGAAQVPPPLPLPGGPSLARGDYLEAQLLRDDGAPYASTDRYEVSSPVPQRVVQTVQLNPK